MGNRLRDALKFGELSVVVRRDDAEPSSEKEKV